MTSETSLLLLFTFVGIRYAKADAETGPIVLTPFAGGGLIAVALTLKVLIVIACPLPWATATTARRVGACPITVTSASCLTVALHCTVNVHAADALVNSVTVAADEIVNVPVILARFSCPATPAVLIGPIVLIQVARSS